MGCAHTAITHVRTVDARPRSRHDDVMAVLRPDAAPVRVLIVDDHPVFHEVARELIGASAGFKWIGAARSGEEAIEQAERLRPDLILMDVRMPGIGGAEAARQIAARGLPAIVVLVTADALPDDAAPASAPAILQKHQLSTRSLTRLWETHGQRACEKS